ncbi:MULTISPECIES: hypothetical protein [Cycloclasticus]|uniref:Secreted protein n=1 Tax=Cycloclasticus pugetii TaxID=34068 RepID=A0AB33Z294_9GAMM|nr:MULTISPECIES: hypothetical protein [Cycloclasticus]ATI01965.1 hypothetical protein CPC19_00375 [Cycloclasticus sp. PY97N]EPD13294.1 hypothetical protein L196_06615 [Cycloclasticus pugetii]
MGIKKTKLGIAAGVLSFSFSMAAQSQAKELPLPAFPATFEDAVYNGEKGCIPNDPKYRFAVMENEGMTNVGRHPMLSIPREGAYILVMMYNKELHYGYMMSNKADGKLCVVNKIHYLESQEKATLLNFNKVTEIDLIKTNECTFEAQVLNLCGTFKQISERLTKAGYRYDWQAKNEDGNIITMLSGAGQSWILTTHAQTGATIFTGAGKGEFKFSEAPK